MLIDNLIRTLDDHTDWPSLEGNLACFLFGVLSAWTGVEYLTGATTDEDYEAGKEATFAYLAKTAKEAE